MRIILFFLVKVGRISGLSFSADGNPEKRIFFAVSKNGYVGKYFSSRMYVFVRTGGNFCPHVGKNPEGICWFRYPASGGGEVEGKGRLQAMAEGAVRDGEPLEEGLGLSEQVHETAAQGRGAEGELGVGFQLQKAQFGFGLQGERGLALGIVFRRMAVFSACGREGVMHGRQGFPFGLQGFQQVEEALLGFQRIGTSIRM